MDCGHQTNKPSTQPWPVLSLPGLTPDSLGRYFVALGLLSISTKRWPSVRGCWVDEEFLLVNGPTEIDSLVGFLDQIAADRKWSVYAKVWDAAQTSDTNRKTARACALWRARDAGEDEVALFDSHLAIGERLAFNQVFGSGGKSTKRDFMKGWEEATDDLASPRRWGRGNLKADLISFLSGQPCSCLDDYNAGSWFSEANKAYNSGAENPYREGQVTPWAMAIACEAFPLLRGATSRRLGGQRRAAGAFPFVVAPAAPESAGAAGTRIGEVWLPFWTRPMSVPEIATMWARGRAEARGRGTVTGPAFATAIVQRGVDGGVTEFRRHVLFHTTSEKTFESRLASVVLVRGNEDNGRSVALNRILDIRDALPEDKKKGKRWLYRGLRGGIDRGLIEYASRLDAESARSLLDHVITSLRKVDANTNYRKRNLRFQPLPGAWSTSLLDDSEPVTPEMRMALALSSLRPTWSKQEVSQKEATGPLFSYWLGAERQHGRYWVISEKIPLRRVWSGTAMLADNLISVIQRRLVEENPDSPPPFVYGLDVDVADIERFVEGTINEDELNRWLLRFSLFNLDSHALNVWRPRLIAAQRRQPLSGAMPLFGLFKPLFDSRLAVSAGASKMIRVAKLRRLSNLLWSGEMDLAIEAAKEAYHSIGIALAETKIPPLPSTSKAFLASLMIPAATELQPLCARWLRPTKNTTRT